MIPTLYYFIGFLVYTGFCMITFNYLIKIEDEMKKKAGFILTYFYYSILVIYLINLVDKDATQFEIMIQSLIYIIAEGFFLKIYYKDIISKSNYNL